MRTTSPVRSFLFLLALSLISFNSSFSQTLYWVGGTGNWSDGSQWSTSSGGLGCSCVPSASVNVTFDANSFTGSGQTVTIDVMAECNTMDWSAVTVSPVLAGSSDMHVYGSLTFKSTITNNWTGALNLESEVTGNLITMDGVALTGGANFNGVGGEWTMQDVFATNGDIYLNNGALLTNSVSVSCANFYSNNSNVRSITLGSSTITCNSFYGSWYTGGSNLTLDAGTSLLKFNYPGGSPSVSAGATDVLYDVSFLTNTSGTVNGGASYHNVTFGTGVGTINANSGTSFNIVTFNGDGNINNNGVYDSLILASGRNYTLESNKTQTINTKLKADGTCSQPIRLQSNSPGAQATISQATGTVTVSYVQMKDMNATGGASFNADFTSDLLNNTGWVMTTSATDLYWIGGSGNWNDALHWSATSGGVSACIIPNPTTDVHFDGNSFVSNGQVVTFNSQAYCKSMDWTGITETSIQMSGASDLKVYGSLTLKSTMVTTNYTGSIYFESTTTGNIANSAGKTFNNGVYFAGNGGEWTLADHLSTTGDVYLNYGTLLTGNKNITANSFNSTGNNVRALTLGTSTVTLTGYYGTWNTGGSNLTINPGTSLVRFTYVGGSPTLSAGASDALYDVLFQSTTSPGTVNGGVSFHNITFSAATGTLNANSGTVFHKVTFNGDGLIYNNGIYDSLIFTPGRAYELESNRTQTINNKLKADGTCAQPIRISSTLAGTSATISQSTGTVTVSYVQMQDITGTGGASFIGNFTSDLGNNVGWVMTSSATDLYWIGGSGNWNDPTHWSTTSGGAAACIIPNPSVNVHFDANSFVTNGQIVTLNVDALCKSMDWSTITKTSIQMSGASDLYVHGSLTLKSGMVLTNFTGDLLLKATAAGNTITSAGLSFTGNVYFSGAGGTWTLQDHFTTAGDIYLNDGTLVTNNKNLTAASLISNGNNVRTLTLGSSTVMLTGYYGYWNSSGSNFTLNAGTSLIKFTYVGGSPSLTAGTTEVFYDLLYQSNAGGTNYLTGGLGYHNVTFGTAASVMSPNNGTTFHRVIFNGDGTLNGNCIYDSLIFSPGKTYVLEGSRTQTINNKLIANGACGQSIVLLSNSAGTQATISQATGTVTVTYLQMQDIKAQGGALFIANNTTNLGNNTGWTINASTPVIAAYTSSQNGLTTTFTNTSSGATSYQWNFGDGNSSTLANPVHTYNLGGNYNVCLIALNSCGDDDTICQTVNPGCIPPVSNFTTTVNGLGVTFNNTSTNAASALWNFGDASTSTVFHPTHTYFSSGTYTVSLIVNNGCGADTTVNTVVVTCVAPVASYYYSVNGMTVNFTNVSSNAASSTWTFGDAQSSSQHSPSHVYNTAGTYNVKLVITNGCGKDSVTQAITISCAAPVSSFITSANGLSVDFVSTSSNATSVSWDFGDGSVPSILPFVNHTYTTTGTYSVCLTANNGCGNHTSCANVSVCAPPVANFTTTVSTFTATFTNTSTNGTGYYWTFGDASASNSTAPVHLYPTGGTYTVGLTASNACGTNTIYKTVQIFCTPFATQPICMVTVDSTSKKNFLLWDKPVTTSIDSFRIYREIASVYTRIGAVPYTALSEFMDNTNGVNPKITSYKYKVSLVDTCGLESPLSAFHQTIHVQISPAVPCGYNLQWNDYVGFPITKYRIMRDTLKSGIYHAADSVSFGITTWTDIKCFTSIDTVSYYVEITHPGGPCVSTLKDPDPMGANLNLSKSNINKVSSTPTGINVENEPELISLYPNPSNGVFMLALNQISGRGEVTVFNMFGERVVNIPVSEKDQKLSIDMNGFAKGIYQVEVKCGNSVLNKKIILQ